MKLLKCNNLEEYEASEKVWLVVGVAKAAENLFWSHKVL